MMAFGALLLRDLAVLRKNFVEFILRTVMQPLLFVFCSPTCSPRWTGRWWTVGTGRVLQHPGAGRHRDRLHLPRDPGGRPAARAGVRIHARDRGPRDGPASRVGRGVGQAPGRRRPGPDRRGRRVPAGPLDPHHPRVSQIEWLRLLTLLPLASVLGAALGLAIGTRADPRRVP